MSSMGTEAKNNTHFIIMEQIGVTHDFASDYWDWPLQHEDDLVRVVNEPDRWEVGLDAGFFAPNEIQVNRMGHSLYIHCKHDEREGEYGTTTREVQRSYKLPDDVDPKSIRSNFTRAGILRITGRKNRS
uniref:SHSP domain-containing protein n=1 Tax=Globodera rostochiensis TaxID=31243 RepID=A0A914HK71_GLORO